MVKSIEKKFFLGIDIGSVSVKLSLLSQAGSLVFNSYLRSQGRPISTFLRLLEELKERLNFSQIAKAGVTGSGGRKIASALEIPFYNEILTQFKAVEKLHPQVRSLVDIGGEDSKLILLEKDEENGKLRIKDFAMNTICAAGTGSFLDQQAQRLGVSIENEFGKLALKSKKPPRVAGRCSVFAKTDMIHLQQEATPDYDIINGLCFALTRSFKNSLMKNKDAAKPLSFQGGVAANQGMVRALAETLGLSKKELIIPAQHKNTGAIGAAFLAKENKIGDWKFSQLEKIEKKLSGLKKEINWLEGLKESKELVSGPKKNSLYPLKTKEGFLGIDVGSISTNLVVIDNNGEVLVKEYLMTAGRPLKVVQTGFEKIYSRLDKNIKIRGVGTTGSGRYLTGDFVGADQIKNEITAQAAAAYHIDPEVDTIFEIGGQDSKYISLDQGTVIDFRMNKVCAAGTGSFLEEQAQKLGIKIKNEYSRQAFNCQRACALGERCTVFMESNLVRAQQQGAGIGELTAGLSYSIAANYLNRVVEDRKIGKKIFFQGGVAFNLAVIAAFEKTLGKKITVPPNHEVTGAVGTALLAKEKSGAKTSFQGFPEIINRKYEFSGFECRDCPNHCRIRKVNLAGKNHLYYGSRCEKYEIKKKEKNKKKLPDFFHERETRLLENYKKYQSKEKIKNNSSIGIPFSMTFYELMPLWTVFFGELGLKIVLSDKTNKNIIHQGTEAVGSETCFPIKAAHGHVINLIKKKVDSIFIPTLINMPNHHPRVKESCNCPYVQSLSHLIKSAIDLKERKINLLNPEITLGWQKKTNLRSLVNFALKLGAKKKPAIAASQKALKAQENFYQKNASRGKKILSQITPGQMVAVIAARSYNSCDQGINLNLPEKLRKLDVLPLPLDYLPLSEASLDGQYSDMYWSHGQKILAAAKIISQSKNLLPVYLTNFGCGPDSFITHFFENEIGNKPYLQLEFDEHSSDVGVITRCEAFTDSVKNWSKKEKFFQPEKNEKKAFQANKFNLTKNRPGKNHKIYIPRMGDHALILEAIMHRGGYQAEVFPQSNSETLSWGRKFTCGKECYPCIVTTGDMVRITKQDSFDPEKSAFFMPSTNGPCRFGQYSRLQRLVLDQIGLTQVPIISPNQGNNLKEEMSFIGKNGYLKAWQAIVAVDTISKIKYKIRPYEAKSGSADKVYSRCLRLIYQAVLNDKPLSKILPEIKNNFSQIETSPEPARPLIGIVGEIFVRNDSFCNRDIIKRVENLGGEVWLSPIAEWISHITRSFKTHSKTQKKYFQYLKAALIEKIQERYERKIVNPFQTLLAGRKEPEIKEIWKYCRRHLPPWFGEAALGIGKTIDLYHRGSAGIIGVMPFTCLPGNIFSSILNAIKKECQNLPTLIIDYDSSGETDITNRLEAFMYQAKQSQERVNSQKVKTKHKLIN